MSVQVIADELALKAGLERPRWDGDVEMWGIGSQTLMLPGTVASGCVETVIRPRVDDEGKFFVPEENNT